MLPTLFILILLYLTSILTSSSSTTTSTSSSSSLDLKSESNNNKDVLLSLLQKVAGVYNDVNKQRGLEKTVLITACNHGFINH